MKMDARPKKAAKPTTRERPALLLHTQTAAAVTTATAIPFNKPAKTSIFD